MALTEEGIIEVEGSPRGAGMTRQGFQCPESSLPPGTGTAYFLVMDAAARISKGSDS
jgi:hypothetical protein